MVDAYWVVIVDFVEQPALCLTPSPVAATARRHTATLLFLQDFPSQNEVIFPRRIVSELHKQG
jgi:hypothetical protein